MQKETCIWCLKSDDISLEHIVPESLGCPESFLLKSGVCPSCNNRFGRLDRALLTPFEIITVLLGVPRKKGKKPTVDGYSSFASDYDENGPAIYINRERFEIKTPTGRVLKGTNSNDPIRDFAYEILPNRKMRTSYNQELRFDKNSVRALFKIALESIAFFESLEIAREKRYDPVRKFMLTGAGDYRAIIMPDANNEHSSYFSPRNTKEGYSDMVGMTILGVGFICDFDPIFRGGKMIMEEAQRQELQAQVIPNYPKSLWKKNNKEFQGDR